MTKQGGRGGFININEPYNDVVLCSGVINLGQSSIPEGFTCRFASEFWPRSHLAITEMTNVNDTEFLNLRMS